MPSEPARVIALLDELQAAERAGAEALGKWVTCCREPALRGGLRVVYARDAAHAALAESRLRTLGGTPGARVGRTLASLCGMLSAPEVSDRSKLAILLARFPEQVYDPFAELTRQIAADDETRALLETIGDDERASLRWLRETSDQPPSEQVPDLLHERTVAIACLDGLHAAAVAAAEVFAAWIGSCLHPGLRGGLRTVAAREQVHAQLAAQRLRELGGAPGATIAAELRAAAVVRYGAADVTDDEKIALVLGRFPDESAVSAVFGVLPARLHDDRETRELLRLIAAGEMDTVGWLRAYHAMGQVDPVRGASA
ncbi:MAG: ferritin-like domain-containing protein [Candidatus Binatia bacterium]